MSFKHVQISLIKCSLSHTIFNDSTSASVAEQHRSKKSEHKHVTSYKSSFLFTQTVFVIKIKKQPHETENYQTAHNSMMIQLQ